MTAPLAPAPKVAPPRPRYRVTAGSADTARPGKLIMLWSEPLGGKTEALCSFPGLLAGYFDPNTSTIEKHGIPYAQLPDKLAMDAFAEDVKGRRMSARAAEWGFEGYSVKTIGIDSSTFQGRLIEEWLDNTDTKGRNRWDVKDRVFNKFYMDLKSATVPKDGAEHYDIVVTAHEKVVKDSDGNVDSVTTAITGGFASALVQYMDAVLFLRKEQECGADGKPIRGTRPRYLCYTTTPDKWRRIVEDRIGGGRYGKLPPVIDVTDKPLYPTLAAAWYGSSNGQR